MLAEGTQQWAAEPRFQTLALHCKCAPPRGAGLHLPVPKAAPGLNYIDRAKEWCDAIRVCHSNFCTCPWGKTQERGLEHPS